MKLRQRAAYVTLSGSCGAFYTIFHALVRDAVNDAVHKLF